MPQIDTAFVLFTEMDVVPSSYHPKGAGIVTSGGVVLFSSSHKIFWVLSFIFATGILLYSYIKLEPPYPSKKIIMTKRAWLVVWSTIFVYSLLSIPWIFNYFDFITATSLNILVLVGETVSACIAIFIPESMLISHAQLLRAQKLYEKVQQLESHQEIEDFGMKSLVEYLRAIPEEQMREIQASE